MNFYSKPLIFQSILVILGVVSFSPGLQAQDVTTPKPTTTPIEAPQPTTGEVKPLESNTPNAATCEGKTPSARPLVPNPSGSLNPPEIETPGASELTPLEGGTSPTSPVPQSRPTSPNP